MNELEEKMKVLNQAMENKDQQVQKLQSDNQNKLQEKTAAIEQEQQKKAQMEEMMTKMQDQLNGMKDESDKQKDLTQQQLEEQKMFLEQKASAEKQGLERRINSLALKQQPQTPSPEKASIPPPPVMANPQSKKLEKQMTMLNNDLKKKDEQLMAQENAFMWKERRAISEVTDAKAQHEQALKDKSVVEDKLRKTMEISNKQGVLTTQQLQEQAARLQAQFEKEKGEMQLERRKQTFLAQKRAELADNARKVKEANEICKILGKDIYMRQILTRVPIDETGRKATLIAGQDPSKVKFKEELQIQVVNNDKRGAVTMWSEQKFEDKLVMMRDALNEYEQQKENMIRQSQRASQVQAQKQIDNDGSMLQRSNISAVNQEIFDQQNQEEKQAKANAEMDNMLLNPNEINVEEKKNDFEDTPLDFDSMLEKRVSEEKPRMPTRAKADNVNFIEQALTSSAALDDISKLRQSAKKIVKDKRKELYQNPSTNQQAGFPNLDNLQGLDAFNMSGESKSKSTVNSSQSQQSNQTNQFDFSVTNQNESMFQDTLFAAFSQNEQPKVDPFAKKDHEPISGTYVKLRREEAPVNERKRNDTVNNKTNIRQDYTTSEPQQNANMPTYYNKDFNPHEIPKDRAHVEVRQTYLHHLLSKYTPVEVQADLFMKPIPRDVGQVQCNIIRDKSGLNKLSPKFYMELTYAKKAMLKAEKLQFSSTAHYKIIINSDEAKYTKNKDQGYLGRLRGNLGQSQFYIFDKGENPDKKNKNVGIRKQYGTIMYTGKDKFGAKEARNMDVYIPQILTNSGTVKAWEDKPNERKQFIDREYTLQQTSKQSQMMSNMSNDNMTSMTDIHEMTSEIMFFKSRNDEGYLDFESTGGQAPVASKKNFQLTDDFDQSKVYMQFGRIDDNKFNVEFSYPYSIFQAFCICLSTFESKL